MFFDIHAVILNTLLIFILTIFAVLLFHLGRHTNSNIYLGIYFISQIIGISYYAFYTLNYYYLVQSIFFSWGPFYYLYILSLLNPQFKFKLKHLLHFLPSIVVLIHLISNSIWNYAANWKQNQELLNGLFNTLIIIYNLAVFYEYYKFRKGQHQFSLKKLIPSVWLQISIFGFAISCILVQVSNAFIAQSNYAYIINTAVFFIFFSSLFYIAIADRIIFNKYEVVEKYKNSTMTLIESLDLISRLDICMKDEKLFVDPELNLKSLASKLNVTEKNLSQAINEHKQLNFSEYINKYRINHAMQLLIEPSLKDNTIFGTMVDSGFNSKTTFNAAFKKIAGCTPNDYKKAHLK